jgi:hypothetical protein
MTLRDALVITGFACVAFGLASPALPANGAEKPSNADSLWLVYEGKAGLAGNGKNIVLIAGEPEYRSEETIPMLARVLSERHGFRCTALFAINPKNNLIDPTCQTNIPGMRQLEDADLLILSIRFMNLPPEQNRFFKEYFASGKPMIGIRTTTHGFHKDNELKAIGPTVFGSWGGHHGQHKVQGTRGVIVEDQKAHPVLIGVKDIFGKTDVYGVTRESLGKMSGPTTPLVLGQILETLEPDSTPVFSGADNKGRKRNDPMLPVIWTRIHDWNNGTKTQVLTTTMGASVDFVHEGLRRIMVNACYWMLGMEDKITPDLDCSTVGEYKPSMYQTIENPEDWWTMKLTPAKLR